MALVPDAKLGPYEILAQIGAGGMGEVYRAKDPRLSREVAIKVLPASFSADADRLRRFEQEAKAAGVLNHPNITAVYDIGSHDGAPYVVQELLEGETLRSTLAGGRLSPRKAIEYSLQIAHGLSAAHGKGIVHRDLKPENVFVTSDNRIKILDFGLAKLTQTEGAASAATSLPTETRGTEPGVVLGTLGYMSPEQVRGRPADARSDIFSFGAILYEMLAGKRAFHGDSAADTMSAILKEEPPDLSVTNQNISPGLERVVRHCLEKNPDLRFQSARDLAFNLEALSGTSGLSVPASPTVPRPRRLRALALAGAAVLLAGAAFWAGRRASIAAKPQPAAPVERVRVTFQRGNLLYARFAPDGQTVVYSAAWGVNPAEIFLARIGSPESRPLGIPNANLLSISSRGELAILLKKANLYGTVGTGTLARVPLEGGAPRHILEDVRNADWAPNGTDLAALRIIDGEGQVEYPIGQKLLTSSGDIELPRVSPDGATVAIIDHLGADGVTLLDRSGTKKPLFRGWVYVDSIAWHPSGRELWAAGIPKDGMQGIYAVDLSGRVRTILETTDLEAIHDIAKNGDVLVEREINTRELLFGTEGEKDERNLSWLDQTNVGSLSEDGRTLLFDEGGEGGGTKGSVYLRKTDGSPPIRLGDGQALDLSPDGKWALMRDYRKDPPGLLIVPTAIGEARPIPLEGLVPGGGVFLPPDGRRIAFYGRGKDGEGDYIVAIDGGKPRKLSHERITAGAAFSPDGKLFAALGPASEPKVYSLDGGDSRPIPGLEPGDMPIQWSADGATLYVTREGEIPKPVYRYSFATGKKTLWKEIVPADRTGLVRIEWVSMTRDGKHYAYSFNRVTASDLYVVRGWK